jgi:hypothetical protein
MAGLVVVGLGIGAVCATGLVVSTALSWFHTFEMDFDNRRESKSERRSSRSSASRDKYRDFSRSVRNNKDLY